MKKKITPVRRGAKVKGPKRVAAQNSGVANTLKEGKKNT